MKRRNGLTTIDILMLVAFVMILIALVLPLLIKEKEIRAKEAEWQKNIDYLVASYKKTLFTATERLIADETGPLTEREKGAFSERAYRVKDKDGQPHLTTYETVLAAFAKWDWPKAQKAHSLCNEMSMLIALVKKTGYHDEPPFQEIQAILDEKNVELELLFEKTE